MRLRVVQRILGLLLMLFSVTMLPPVVVSYIFQDGGSTAFLYAFGFTVVAGVLIWLPVRFQEEDLRLRDGFLHAGIGQPHSWIEYFCGGRQAHECRFKRHASDSVGGVL